MIYTVEQAKYMVCHQSIGVFANYGAGDSGFVLPEKCYAAQCMAWRWWDNVDRNGARRGYCGLAAKPEQV